MNKYSKILMNIVNDKKKPNKWNGSSHGGYYSLSNTEKGDSVECLIGTVLTENGIDILPKNSRIGDDTTIMGYKGKMLPTPIVIEDKSASEDKHSNFQFNHVRKDKEYNYLLLVGITPENILFNIFPKTDVLSGIAGTLTPMGKKQGGVGDEGTFKITKCDKNLLSFNDEFLNKILTIIKQYS